MKRRKFIFGMLAVLTVPMLPNIQTEPTYEEYVAWFKKEYSVTPDTTYHGISCVGDLVGLRKDFELSNSILRQGYTQQGWDKRRKKVLKELKVLTFEEYKRYIA